MPTRHTPRISIELVPRDAKTLARELGVLGEHFPFIDTVNIPDLTRFSFRSHEACAFSQQRVRRAIPHLRAVGTNLKDLNPLLTFLDRRRAARSLDRCR